MSISNGITQGRIFVIAPIYIYNWKWVGNPVDFKKSLRKAPMRCYSRTILNTPIFILFLHLSFTNIIDVPLWLCILMIFSIMANIIIDGRGQIQIFLHSSVPVWHALGLKYDVCMIHLIISFCNSHFVKPLFLDCRLVYVAGLYELTCGPAPDNN